MMNIDDLENTVDDLDCDIDNIAQFARELISTIAPLLNDGDEERLRKRLQELVR